MKPSAPPYSVQSLAWGAALAALVGPVPGCSARSVEPPERADREGVTSAFLTRNTVVRESFDSQGRQGHASSTTPSISPNQRYVAFESESNAWAPSVDTNGLSDVYLKDRQTGSITLVSAANGVVGNGGSFDPSVRDDGAVAFVSDATNLADGGTGPFAKILVRGSNGAIRRVDVALSGEADGPSTHPQLSGDGTTVVFQSDATNLVPGDTNRATDVFVATASSVTRVSLTQAGAQTNGRSYEGTVDYAGGVVAFASDASNILFNDGNQATDVFAVDLRTSDVVPISFATTGLGGSVGSAASSEPSLSGDGRTVVFRSFAANFDGQANGLATLYVNPVRSGRSPTPVSVASSGAPADRTCYESAISYDGRLVAFTSIATNLGSGSSHGAAGVFVHDRATGETVRVDLGVTGAPADGSALINSSLRFSGSPSMPSPSFLVFDSVAGDLVYGDTNGVADVFSASLSP